MNKVIIFLLTFFSYAGLHCMRQGWSYTKPELQKQFNIKQSQLGLIDTLYLIFYSVGMATIGNLTSKINLRYFIGIGMILSSLFFSSFAIVYLISSQFSYIFVCVMMCLNGFIQSTGWPGIMGVMGNWFGKGNRGLLMGVWAINANVGNIIASVMCSIIQEDEHWSWPSNFIFTGGFAAFIGILVLIFIRQQPQHKKQQPLLDTIQNQSDQIKKTQEANQKHQKYTKSILSQNNQQQEDSDSFLEPEHPQEKKINVFSALLLPKVPFYVIGYALTKGFIYGLLFWLPTYLDGKGLGSQKGYIASMIDIGSFIGGLIVGHLGDKYSYRALFLSPLLFMGSILMFLVAFTFTDIAWMYYIAMFFIGALSGGPYNIIGSAITIDIGESIGKHNVGKVSALIEGSGAVFAAISQLIIGSIQFSAIFYLFSTQCLVAALALLPLFLKDYTNWKYR